MEKTFEKRVEKTGFPRRDTFFIASRLLKSWSSVEPPKPDEIVATFSPEIVKRENGIFVLKEISGWPRDIFTALNIGDQSASLDLRSKIRNSNNVELFGASGPHSIYDVACFLGSHGYQGKLRVVDIASFPLEATRPYLKRGTFGLRSNQFNLANSSVLDLDLAESADLILADVLSLYLSPKELSQLAVSTAERLSDSGLYITRDLVEPSGPPPPQKRSVSGQNEATELQKFISDNYGVKMSLEEIQKRQDGIWAGIDTYPRSRVDDYIDPFRGAGLVLKQSIPITSEAIYETESPRIFYINVFEKK